MKNTTSYKLPKSTTPFIMPLILSIFMTCIVSAISTMRNVGITVEAFHMWPTAWLISWVFAFPTLLLVLPVVKQIVKLIAHSE